MRSREWASFVFVSFTAACSAGNSKDPAPDTLDGSVQTDGASFDVTGLGDVDVDASTDEVGVIPDPSTCAEAASSKTYVGCDFWPTVVDNIVNPIFDFAVAVANTGDTDADVEVTRGTTSVAKAKVPANGLTTVYLPWVEDLKSTMPNNGCPTNVKTATVRAKGGAYHLTSSRPVAVYQFNAIEYAGKGGPAGKDWATACKANCLGLVQCFSYTNDASLLLPSTALTGNYRIAGTSPWSDPSATSSFTYPSYFAVTGTKDGTTVTVQLSSTAAIAAGGGVSASGGKATFPIDAGEVVMVVGTSTGDFSGSLVKATAPVQVITGISCTNMPADKVACDHVEESVLPVETLGKHYFVTVPTGPAGVAVGHVVRIYGNVDGTKLTYPGGKPTGAPDTIDAGAMIELGTVTDDFEIVGDHEFTVASFQLGAGPISGSRKGDPSQSFATAVEQYRLKYVFLAPSDYDVDYVDVVQPLDAALTLDGASVGTKPKDIGSGFGVARVLLGAGKGGAHVLTATKPVGIQVLGYGSYTSFQYPGGLNLGHIAPPPIK